MVERQLPKLRTRVRFPSPAQTPCTEMHFLKGHWELSGVRFTRTAGIQRGPAVELILLRKA